MAISTSMDAATFAMPFFAVGTPRKLPAVPPSSLPAPYSAILDSQRLRLVGFDDVGYHPRRGNRRDGNLDDDERFVIENLARALPPDSAYDRRWFENKLATQRSSG